MYCNERSRACHKSIVQNTNEITLIWTTWSSRVDHPRVLSRTHVRMSLVTILISYVRIDFVSRHRFMADHLIFAVRSPHAQHAEKYATHATPGTFAFILCAVCVACAISIFLLSHALDCRFFYRHTPGSGVYWGDFVALSLFDVRLFPVTRQTLFCIRPSIKNTCHKYTKKTP